MRNHFLGYRYVAVYGGIYFATLAIASGLFYRLVTTPFSHLYFWTWCLWTFVTAYAFYLFMRAVLTPVVQIYPHEVVLKFPRQRVIPRSALTALKSSDSYIDISLIEDSKAENIRVPVRSELQDD